MIPGIEKIKSPSTLISFLLVIGVLFGLILFDNLIHSPAEQLTAHLVVMVIDGYQAFMSPTVSAIGHCKFFPTCSDYMKIAVLKYGSCKGVRKGLWRICRCSPFTSQSGMDYP